MGNKLTDKISCVSSRTRSKCIFVVRKISLKTATFYKDHKKPLQRYGLSAITAITIVSILIGFLPQDNLRAQNYNKTWTTTADFDEGTNSNINTSDNEAKLATTTNNFGEDFTDTTYKDAATDANWDAVANKLTLPGDPTEGVATDLQTAWKSAVGTSESIKSSVYDSANHFIYLGGSDGSLVAYSPAMESAISLTPKISADWAVSDINALAFDSTNGYIYLGGTYGEFGVFTGGADPADGTWIDLRTQLTAPDFDNASYWAYNTIYALTFDSIKAISISVVITADLVSCRQPLIPLPLLAGHI